MEKRNIQNSQGKRGKIRSAGDRDAKTAKSMRGIMKQFQADPELPKTTDEWMKLLRDGDRE